MKRTKTKQLSKPPEQTRKQKLLLAWRNATSGEKLSPLLKAIGSAIAGTPDDDGKTFSYEHKLRIFSRRIANGSISSHCNIAALRYCNNYVGEWYVRNSDALLFGRIKMWAARYLLDGDYCLGDIMGAIQMKRLQQAYDRYQKTGLKKEHLKLLGKLLWAMDVSRGDWISLYVQGKRPLGNSSIVYDIYENVGWSTAGFDGDKGPTEEQEEVAWNLFDELVFAAPDAAKLALKSL